MKTLLISILLLVPTIIKAQNDGGSDKPSWWNDGQVKKENNDGQASTVNIKIVSSMLKLDSIYMAKLKRSIFVLQQDYSLYDKKKKKYYGYDGEDYFGRTFSLGLKCENFNILMDEAVHPWMYDTKYESYKEKNLVPEITGSKYFFINDSTSSIGAELDSIFAIKDPIKDDFFYTSGPFLTDQENFTINVADTNRVGVLVWVINESGKINSEQLKIGLKYSTLRTEMIGTVSVTPPVSKESVIGGFFLTESGKKDNPYSLSGIVVLRNGTWNLHFPFKNFSVGVNKKKEENKLTEIKKPLSEINNRNKK